MVKRGLATCLDPLCEISARYEKIKDLGSGSFGFVQHAHDKFTGEQVAIKFLERGASINRNVESEIMNHRQLAHPHVIQLKEVFLTRDYICIAMEHANKGTLFDFVQQHGHLRECQARFFFQQLVLGLDFCHQKGIVNRDMKLENTLLLQLPQYPLPLLKICDFGYSKAEYLSAPKSLVGTVTYMAPEVLTSAGRYDGRKADIWSCGVMLFAMLFGCFPFEPADDRISCGQRVLLILDNINKLDMLAPSHIPVSASCTDLLRRLLVADPGQRLSVQEIMQHPWFLTNLPPGALTMNDEQMHMEEPDWYQSTEEIREIIEEARRPPEYVCEIGSPVEGLIYDTVEEVFSW